MYTAFDINDKRVVADDVDKTVMCHCPACNESVILKRGRINRPHFAHLPDSQCIYRFDKNNMSEWHIRMQGYFPKDAREVWFKEDRTNEESHRADVFLSDSNTVLEFQHSPIDIDEFRSRTLYHLNKGRRIAWMFDESSKGKDNSFGKFKCLDDNMMNYPEYDWIRCPRKVLRLLPNLRQLYSRYSVCVYTGTEGDVFHRIVDSGFGQFHTVRFSAQNIIMDKEMDIDQLFLYDDYWSMLDRRSTRPIQKNSSSYITYTFKTRTRPSRRL